MSYLSENGLVQRVELRDNLDDTKNLDLEYLKYIKTLDLAKNIIVFYNRGTISEKLELTISSTVKIKDFDTVFKIPKNYQKCDL